MMLVQCFQALKLYGKEPEQIEGVIGMFNLVLADYPFSEIERAFRYYLRHNTEMPAPADIAIIIDRGGDKPPFDKSVYVAFSKKHGDQRTPAEWQYMRDYERFISTGRY